MWQPIETAPKDGTEILLYADGGCEVGYWGSQNTDENGWTEKRDNDQVQATHWMSLPDPPAVPGADGGTTGGSGTDV